MPAPGTTIPPLQHHHTPDSVPPYPRFSTTIPPIQYQGAYAHPGTGVILLPDAVETISKTALPLST
eukprot:208988-Rhodomonas_salina.1